MEYPSHYIKFPSHYIVVLPCDTPVAEFDAAVVDLDVIINTALHIGDQFQHKVTLTTDVAVIDADTGEVVWNYRDNVADGWHTNEYGENVEVECEEKNKDEEIVNKIFRSYKSPFISSWAPGEPLPSLEEEEDPATYEFEPGRIYWDEMAANP